MTTGQAERWTVLRLLQWTTEYFKKRGFESARLDAEVLLAEVCECSRIELYTSFETEPEEQARVAYRELVKRRGEGQPVAYLVGHKEFYSIELRVSEAVLIPRPETEHVVVEALDRIKELRSTADTEGSAVHTPIRIADICTGSGAIAVAIAKNSEDTEITAIDISSEALAIAAYNVQRYDLGSRITLVEADLLDGIPETASLDIICANPPYVSESEFAELSREVAGFEPRLALVSGPTGTELIQRLIDQSATRLAPSGRLIFELSPMIADACADLVRKSGKYGEVRFIKDTAGHRRLISVARLA